MGFSFWILRWFLTIWILDGFLTTWIFNSVGLDHSEFRWVFDNMDFLIGWVLITWILNHKL